MNTKSLLHSLRRPAMALACAGLLAAAPGLSAQEDYENHVDFAFGMNSVSGHAPAFQRNHQQVEDGFGGIESLLYKRELDDTTGLVLKGRALAGENDYLFDLTITREDVGYLKFGYKEFRTYYDGMGGYWQPTGYMARLFDEDLSVDRGNLWFEAGYTPEDKVNVKVRYDYLTRKGTKDSTSWADTGLAVNAANTRYITPAFMTIDEKRHILTADVSQKLETQEWGLGVRVDEGDYENTRNMNRRPGESSDRKLTQKEGQDFDLFQMRGSYLNQVSEVFTLTTAVARTTIDTVLSGSRIYGQVYDAVFDPVAAGRQQRDEGFYGLHGESEMEQTVATISGAYRPTKNLTVVPSLRFEKLDWKSVADMEETNVGGGPGFVTAIEEIESRSNKDWDIRTQSLEVRYKAAKDWVINGSIELNQSEGGLTELETVEPGTPAAHVGLDRDTKIDRDTQKYAVTAHWYPQAGTSVSFQYYFKARQNDYRATRDSSTTTADRYPAYITQQDFETNDFNVRLSRRITGNLRSVTRYDYQESTIRSQEAGLGFAQSMETKAHILSESLSWNPTARWYLQGSVNLVWDTLRTPATTIGGTAAGLVKNSDANYRFFSLSSGYALDDNADLFVDYSHYESNNSFQDNSAKTVPYGTDNMSQTLGVAYTRALSDRVRLTVKYAYTEYEDFVSGYQADYDAHMLYSKIQYRF
ncbi:MAG: hypothetical protein H3C27_07055 [Opitutaceae bacterium]|nr:hypothetical protein [Opitutaceae bacterium]